MTLYSNNNNESFNFTGYENGVSIFAKVIAFEIRKVPNINDIEDRETISKFRKMPFKEAILHTFRIIN